MTQRRFFVNSPQNSQEDQGVKGVDLENNVLELVFNDQDEFDQVSEMTLSELEQLGYFTVA